MENKKIDQTEALLLQVASMSKILDNIDAFVFIKDLKSRYTYVNSNIINLFQVPADHIIGNDDSHFFDKKTVEKIHQTDLNVIRKKIPHQLEESNVIKASGQARIYRTNKYPLFDHKNNVIGLYGISTDITATKQLEIKNKEQKQLLDVILNNVDAYIYMKDSNRHFKYVNSKVADLFGLPAEKIIDRLDSDVLPKEQADHFWQTDKLVFENNDKIIINETSEGSDNKIHHYLSTKVPYNFHNDNKTLIGFSTDITELYQLKEKFKRLANTDELTNIYNRRYFFENANNEFSRAKRHHQHLAVISFDVDHFKAVNDVYGHPIGDQMLIQITQLIAPTIRAEDIFARIGGEEFSILLPNTSKLQSQKTAERLRCLFDQKIIYLSDDTQLSITISLGVSMLKSNDTCFQDLYSRSDFAMYQAKSNGRNQVFVID